jgi:Cys-tRNA(Pro)/Cys-tRNA(Cys) deacylase
MTPAIKTVKLAKIEFRIHEYEHDPSCESYGEEAAIKMGVKPGRVFKTLVVSPDGIEFVVAVVPVPKQLDLKRFARAIGVKKWQWPTRKT